MTHDTDGIGVPTDSATSSKAFCMFPKDVLKCHKSGTMYTCTYVRILPFRLWVTFSCDFCFMEFGWSWGIICYLSLHRSYIVGVTLLCSADTALLIVWVWSTGISNFYCFTDWGKDHHEYFTCKIQLANVVTMCMGNFHKQACLL